MNQVGEIDIGKRWISPGPMPVERRDGSWEMIPDDQRVSGAELVGEIERHRAAGARCLLVTLDGCGGGIVVDSLNVYQALRAFSEAGGKVVVHVRGIIGSIAPQVATAGDLVVVEESAKALLHAGRRGREVIASMTDGMLPWFMARTTASEADMRVWLSCGTAESPHPVAMLDAAAMIAYGFADAVGPLEFARSLAGALTYQPLPLTPRGRALRTRAPAALPAWVESGATCSLQTSDYAETAGIPTAGAKMQNVNALALIAVMARSTAYSVGDTCRIASGLAYRCITAGTTASGSEPNTTGSDITDGTCHWATYAPLRVGPAGMQLGNMLIDEVQAGTMRAIARSDANATKVWYRGNNDKDTLGGAPNIGRLTITRRRWEAAMVFFDFALAPQAASDNLDAMRYAQVDLYFQYLSGTGSQSGNSPVPAGTFYVPLTDRLYAHATDSNAANKAYASLCIPVPDLAFYSGYRPCMVVTIYNAYGPSAAHCFYSSASGTNGMALVDNGTTFPSGWSLSAPPSGGNGGGGGGGGSCLDPATPVLVSPTESVPLHALRPGDMVWTRPEDGGEMGYHAVTDVLHTTNLRQLVEMRDGRSFTCSINHLVRVHGLWRRADTLQPGEEMEGQPSGIIERVAYLGEGPVVKLTIPTARTFYDAAGLWQHNAMKQ